MIAQQLTPELTQPNVLVEIDHGPPMGLYQEARQPAPGELPAQMLDTMSSVKKASLSKSSCRGPHPEPTKSIDLESAGIRTEVLGVGSVECTENVLTFHRLEEGQGARMELPRRVQNSWSPMTGLAPFRSVGSPGIRVVRLAPSEKEYQVPHMLHSVFRHEQPEYVALSHTWGNASEQVVERVFDSPHYMAMSLGYGWCHPEEVRVVDKTMPFPDGLRKHSVAFLDEPEKERRVLRPCPMTKSSGDVGTHQQEACQRALFDTHSANLADAALRGKLESVTGPVSIARISGSVSTMDRHHEGAGCRTLPTPLKHHKVLSKEFFESEGNEKWMAEGDGSAVPGKPRNHFHYDLPTRDIRSGPMRGTQSSKKKDVMPVERALFMSWAAGSKKSLEVEPEEIARDILMWMIEYNLMTSHCEKQKLLALAHQSLGQLLNLMEAAVSCIRILLLHGQLERNARDKQCTGEVHCLLDDPG